MKKLILFVLAVALITAVVLRLRYGGGEPYVDLTSQPRLPESSLETVLSYPQPIGNVAVNSGGRVFFTVHPEARPTGNKLLEYVNGASVPYPDGRSQQELFDTVLGVAIDTNNRLWTIDHGNHGFRPARLTAIDLATGEVLRQHSLPESIAPKGSFLQDLQISRDGRTVIIADASFWRKQPAIIVYDVETGDARRRLQSHHSVSPENFVIESEGRRMMFMGGLLTLQGGIDGIALDKDWLYYGALNGSALYRVSLADLLNDNLPETQLAARVERFSDKPLSDGLSVDLEGNVYLTDVEHNAVFAVDQAQTLDTVVRSRQVRWPDALSFGPDGWLYLADSALSEVIFRSPEHIDQQGPYRIFRFQPGTDGTPGQ